MSEEITPLYPKDECDADLPESMAILGAHRCSMRVSHAINIVNSMISHLRSQAKELRVEYCLALGREQVAHDKRIEFMATVAKQEIAKAEAQLSQALLELDAARSHGSALLRDVELAEAQLATALRERDEARAQIDSWRARCAELEALQP